MLIMWTSNNRIKCNICGKIISWGDKRYCWIPRNYDGALSPPESVADAHKKCYEDLDKNMINIIENTSFQKPKLVL